MEYEKRAGFFMNASSGYKAFVPAPLPPEPPIQYKTFNRYFHRPTENLDD